MIHPERHTRNEPYRDFHKVAEVCRAMEVKYGLAVDNGISRDGSLRRGVSQRAASLEAHAGEQSFQSYALERKADIVRALETAANWQDVHVVFARHGMEIKPRANGLAVVRQGGTEAIKASAMDRRLSKSRLVAKLGNYEGPRNDGAAADDARQTAATYERKPIQPQSTARDALFRAYKALAEQRQQQVEEARKRTSDSTREIVQRYAKAREQLKYRILSHEVKADARRMHHINEREELLLARQAGHDELQKIRNQQPYHNWHGYLKWQAEQGNETALAVLRSRQQQGAGKEQAAGVDLDEKRQTVTKIKLEGLAKERQIAALSLNWQDKNAVEAVNRMKQLAALERVDGKTGAIFAGVKHTIDNQGVMIFTLANGGTIRDAGKKLYFSPGQDTAARIYANAKFGKRIIVNGNAIERGTNERPKSRSAAKQSYLAHVKQICANGVRKLSQLNVVRIGKSDKVLLPDHACADLER